MFSPKNVFPSSDFFVSTHHLVVQHSLTLLYCINLCQAVMILLFVNMNTLATGGIISFLSSMVMWSLGSNLSHAAEAVLRLLMDFPVILLV